MWYQTLKKLPEGVMLLDNTKYELEFANEAMYELLEVCIDSDNLERTESNQSSRRKI